MVPFWWKPYIMLLEHIDEAGRIPWLIAKLFRYAHFCAGMDGFLILRKNELCCCFCGMLGELPEEIRANEIERDGAAREINF